MAAGKWERTARAAVKPYRNHPDYDDLLQVAQIAAWQSPEDAYIAALNAARMWLRSPRNIHRTHTRGGAEILPAVPLHLVYQLEKDTDKLGLRELYGMEAALRLGLDYQNPELIAVNRVWKEWALSLPELAPVERQVLALWVQSADNFPEISARFGRSRTYANVMVERACVKIRTAMGVARPVRQTKVSPEEEERIRELAAAGMPHKQIAKATGRDKKTVLNILRVGTQP